ncbi:MAG: hypothetical protein H6635_05135 [Anaerolineales bacterium]|nr:hypothetical protein [Anaerolineales bacterium]MCB9144733.1 hypothetical protein [Anaerolineales bacterium]
MQITPLYTSVEKQIDLKVGTIILENPNGCPINETNLYMINSEGDIVWKAEKPALNTLFTKLKLNEEDMSLSTFTNGGQFCELEIETGKIISSSNFM